MNRLCGSTESPVHTAPPKQNLSKIQNHDQKNFDPQKYSCAFKKALVHHTTILLLLHFCYTTTAAATTNYYTITTYYNY